MNWIDRIHVGVDAAFGLDNEPPPDNVSRLSRRQLTDDDRESFQSSADARVNPLITQMEDLLHANRAKHPARVGRMTRDLKWLRHEAYKLGLPWGKKCRWTERL